MNFRKPIMEMIKLPYGDSQAVVVTDDPKGEIPKLEEEGNKITH